MWQQYSARIGLVVVLLSMMVALGIFLFAQEPPPSEGGYGGTGQPAPCICIAPSTPPAPEWIKVTEVDFCPKRKFALNGNPFPLVQQALLPTPLVILSEILPLAPIPSISFPDTVCGGGSFTTVLALLPSLIMSPICKLLDTAQNPKPSLKTPLSSLTILLFSMPSKFKLSDTSLALVTNLPAQVARKSFTVNGVPSLSAMSS